MRTALGILFTFICSISVSAQNKYLTVYFPFAQSELEISERLRLLYFLSDSLDNDRTYRIAVRGYCDVIDDDKVNNPLSLARANYVREILVSNGIQQETVTSVQGLGERTEDKNKNYEAERRLQRRVEIDFICTCTDTFVHDETAEEMEEDANAEEVIRVIQGDTVEDRKGVRYKGRYLVENDLELQRFDVGDSIVLVRMHFQPGRHKLLNESVPILFRLTEQLKQNPNMHILIVGHVCCASSLEWDGFDNDTRKYELSQNRAKEIYSYLISKGIEKDRLAYDSMGPRQKLYPEEKNGREQQGNRRVEIVIISK